MIFLHRKNNFGIIQKVFKKGNKKIQHNSMFYPQFLIFENHIQFLTSHTESHENDPSRKVYHPSKNGKCTTHKFKEICFRKIFHPSKKMVNYPLLKSENDPSLTILMYVM